MEGEWENAVPRQPGHQNESSPGFGSSAIVTTRPMHGQGRTWAAVSIPALHRTEAAAAVHTVRTTTWLHYDWGLSHTLVTGEAPQHTPTPSPPPPTPPLPHTHTMYHVYARHKRSTQIRKCTGCAPTDFLFINRRKNRSRQAPDNCLIHTTGKAI